MNIICNLRWTEYAPMTVARKYFALVWSPVGRLFAVGGIDDKGKPSASVEMLACPWDTEGEAGNAWMPVAPMCRARGFHGACVFEGKLFAVGGKQEDSVECFVMPSVDLPNGQWTTIRPIYNMNEIVGLIPFGGSLLIIGQYNTLYLK